MKTAPMADKSGQPSHEPPRSVETGPTVKTAEEGGVGGKLPGQ